MDNIIELAKKLSEKRQLIKESEEVLNALKEERDQLQFDLIVALKESGLKSIKTNEANYSLTVKKDVKVTDENAVIEKLKELGQYDDYVKPKLDTLMFKSLAKSMLESSGEVFDGTEPTETAYISIKSI